MESIKNKGQSYISAIPRHRVLVTLLKFDMAVCVFLVVQALFGNFYTPLRICEALLAWKGVGNSNWYIFAILVLYIFSWVSAMLVRGNYKYVPLIVTLLTVLYIIVMMSVRYNDAQFYNTVLCYPMGMSFSIHRQTVERFYENKFNYWLIVLVLLVCFIVLKAFETSGTSPLIIFEALLFSALVVSFTMKVNIKSKILSWCGFYLFEIYILQRLPMLVFSHIGLAKLNIEFYFLTCLLFTLLLAYLFRRSTKWIKI